jgi:succinate dehydrogenase/fumarate reductase flavoprotein subunit
MEPIRMVEEMIERDVLCVGGGIAGLMAAIRACERGASVIVVDKANTVRSGSGGTGNDHFRCYLPEFHGPDIESVIQDVKAGDAGTRSDSFIRTWMEKSSEIVKLWDSWGIPMRYKGNWEFAGHTFPGGIFSWLKYSGQNQKLVLTKEARRRGATIVNRVMIFDLLRNDEGNLIGAVGVDTRENKVVSFLAKSIVLGTGRPVRLYPSATPGWMFNRPDAPHTTGDGRAMAYRAGAELVDLEMPMRWAGPKYFARCGKATWVGVFRDPHGRPVGPFVQKPDRRYGDAISDTYRSLFEDYAKSGKGPVYMDCGGISDEDYEYMLYWMTHEGNTAILNHLKDEEIDIKDHPVEFMTYEMGTMGGVYFNERAETSLKGLFAAGDEYRGGISCAATFGWIAGENAAIHAEKNDSPKSGGLKSRIEEKKTMVEKILARSVGIPWQEANIALQQTLFDYAGAVRSEQMLKAGYEHLKRINKKAQAELKAKNQHELVHCLEVLNLMDLGELIFAGILERKETREKCYRTDYPFTNPMLNGKRLVYRRGEKGPLVEWKEKNH